MTHKEPPWRETRGNLRGEKSQKIISDKIMQQYFSGLVQNNEQRGVCELTEETIRVIEDSKQGIGVTTFNSIEELYKDLGI